MSSLTHNRQCRQRGLGMIEVLVAGVVLAVAVIGTTSLMVTWVRSLSDAGVRSDSLSYANQCLESARYKLDACANADSMASVRVSVERDYTASTSLAGTLLEVSTLWADPFSPDIDRRMQVRTRVPGDAQVVRPVQLVEALALAIPPVAETGLNGNAGSDPNGDPNLVVLDEELLALPWTGTLTVIGHTRAGDGEFAVSTTPNCSGSMERTEIGYTWQCTKEQPAGTVWDVSLRVRPDKNYCTGAAGSVEPRDATYTTTTTVSSTRPNYRLFLEFTEGDADENHGCVNGPRARLE